MPRAIGRSVGVVLVGVLALTSSGCSGPSEAARTLCTLVGQVLGAPPNSSVAITLPLLVTAESTGDSRLDVAARHLVAAMNRRSTQAISRADSEIQTACVRLGIWQTYHGSG
jgi:hypothetical protein